jgi:hypothetical protein
MDKNRFNREVRHQLTEIPIGKQGIAFDRLEMDAWVEQYKSRCGCSTNHRSNSLCRKEHRASSSGAKTASGQSTNVSEDMAAFSKALARVTGRKPSNT